MPADWHLEILLGGEQGAGGAGGGRGEVEVGAGGVGARCGEGGEGVEQGAYRARSQSAPACLSRRNTMMSTWRSFLITLPTKVRCSLSSTWWPSISFGSKRCSSLSRLLCTSCRTSLWNLSSHHLSSMVSMVAEEGGLLETRARALDILSMASSILSLSLSQASHLAKRVATLLSSSSHSPMSRG